MSSHSSSRGVKKETAGQAVFPAYPSAAFQSDFASPFRGSELGFYAELSKAKNIADLKRRIMAIVQRLGFSDFAFVRMEAIEVELCPDDSEKLLTHPKEQMDDYSNENFFEFDMQIAYAKENVTPIFMSQIYGYAYKAPFQTELLRRNQEIYTINKKYGYLDCYCIPIEACDGRGNVLLGVSQKNLDPIEFQAKIIPCKLKLKYLCESIDHICTHKFPEYYVDQNEAAITNIRPRALEVLDTLANLDVSIKQVADRLEISIDTVNQHLAVARKALGVKTTIGAIRTAVLDGLIIFKK